MRDLGCQPDQFQLAVTQKKEKREENKNIKKKQNNVEQKRSNKRKTRKEVCEGGRKNKEKEPLLHAAFVWVLKKIWTNACTKR